MPQKNPKTIVAYDQSAIIRLQNPMGTRQTEGNALLDNWAKTTTAIRLATVSEVSVEVLVTASSQSNRLRIKVGTFTHVI